MNTRTLFAYLFFALMGLSLVVEGYIGLRAAWRWGDIIVAMAYLSGGGLVLGYFGRMSWWELRSRYLRRRAAKWKPNVWR